MTLLPLRASRVAGLVAAATNETSREHGWCSDHLANERYLYAAGCRDFSPCAIRRQGRKGIPRGEREAEAIAE